MSLVKHFFGHYIVVGLALVLAGPAELQADAFYVDDDALNDSRPGDSNISDLNKDGSAAHPFDAIEEDIDAAFGGDEVVVADGTGDGLIGVIVTDTKLPMAYSVFEIVPSAGPPRR